MASLATKLSRRATRLLITVQQRLFGNHLGLGQDLWRRAMRELAARRALAARSPDDPRPIVFAIVNNPAIHDSRVMKQARSLQASGYRVILFATPHPEWPNHHIADGIEIRRFDMFTHEITLPPERLDQVLDLFGVERDLVAGLLDQLAQTTKRIEPASGLLKVWNFKARRGRRAALKAHKKARREVQPWLKFVYATAAMAKIDFAEKPAVIHAHDLFPLGGAILWAERCGARVIYDAHEIETERVPPMPPDRKRFVDQIERHWLRRTDAMVLCCESAAEFYAGRFDGPRPTVVMNAPETSAYGGDPYDLRQACGIAQSTPLIVYTGGVGREGRGLHLVLEALAKLDGFHLAVLGPRHAGNDAWLMGFAQRLGVVDRLHCLVPVAPQAVVGAIQSADLGISLIQDVSLSYRYALPNKLFESAFAGIPMVVSDLPEMGRFVRETGIGVTVDQTDPVSIAAGIAEVYRQRAAYSPNPEKLRAILATYGWPIQADALLATYRTVLRRDDVPTQIGEAERLCG